MAEPYILPNRFSHQRAATIRMAEYLFCLAKQSLPLEFKVEDAVGLTGLSRRAIGTVLGNLLKSELLKNVVPPEQRNLRMDPVTGKDEEIKGPYRYTIPEYDRLVEGGIEKPMGYVTNGWLSMVPGRLGLLLVNQVYASKAISLRDLRQLRRTLRRHSAAHFVRFSEFRIAMNNLVGLGIVNRLPAESIDDPLFIANQEILGTDPAT